MPTSENKNPYIAAQHVGAREAIVPRYTPITENRSSALYNNKKPKQSREVCLADALDKPQVLMNRTDQLTA